MARKKNQKNQEQESDVQVLSEETLVAEMLTAEDDSENESSEENSEEMDEMNEELGDVEVETSIFLQEEEETEGFLPEGDENDVEEMLADEDTVSVDGTELDNFESAEIEEVEFVEEERLESIVESILFASDRPVSLASLKLVFKGTNVRTNHLKRALDQLAVEFAGGRRGVTLEEVPGGYQLRTKIDNMEFLRRTLKARSFKLSGPALEVLSIVAYKQPTVKAEIDEIRGVESGHLLRALMEKNLVCFEGKSELPGRPMQYGTTRKFLEIFGLRNLKELPTLSQIDELLPEGIDEQQAQEKPTLSSLTDALSEQISTNYSQGEDELLKISEQLEDITTTTNFFEDEKRRQAEKRDAEKAQNIREALEMGEPVSTRDTNWLAKFDEALAAGTTLVAMKEAEAAARREVFANTRGAKATSTDENNVSEALAEMSESEVQAQGETSEEMTDENLEESEELQEAIAAFDSDEDTEVASSDENNQDLDEEISEEEAEEDELAFLAEAEDIDEDGEGDATV
jgi:segregation and condensation protein B